MPAKTGSYLACFVGIAADLRETHLEHVPRDTLFELGIWCCVGVRVTLSEPPGSGFGPRGSGLLPGRLLLAERV